MTPHDSIIIRLPYPVKFLTIPRKIGFSFTNMAIYLFRDEHGLKDENDYKEWLKENGEARFVSEMLYSAARAYCYLNKQKENFTKEGLTKALALCITEKQNQILAVWRASETFGATVKKKVSGQVIRQ